MKTRHDEAYDIDPDPRGSHGKDALEELPTTVAAVGGLATLYGAALGFVVVLSAPLGYAQGINALALPVAIAAIGGGLGVIFRTKWGVALLFPTMVVALIFMVSKLNLVTDPASGIAAVFFVGVPLVVIGLLVRRSFSTAR